MSCACSSTDSSVTSRLRVEVVEQLLLLGEEALAELLEGVLRASWRRAAFRAASATALAGAFAGAFGAAFERRDFAGAFAGAFFAAVEDFVTMGPLPLPTFRDASGRPSGGPNRCAGPVENRGTLAQRRREGGACIVGTPRGVRSTFYTLRRGAECRR